MLWHWNASQIDHIKLIIATIPENTSKRKGTYAVTVISPSMALHPLPGLGLPHKTPPFISIRSSSPPSSYPQQL